MNRPFTKRKFNKNTWVIEGEGSYSYLVLGEKKALMVDTGMSKLNLREYAETITDLPIAVVNSHGHFDHTGGNGYFDEVYMHPAGVPEAKMVISFDGTDASKDYPLNYEIKTVTEGYVFDLGGRTLEVIEIGAHSAGSIALLDRENRLLFSGDELECGQVLLFYGTAEIGATVALHQSNMKKLKARMDEFDYICPGHNGTPIDKSYIDTYIENDQMVIDGAEGKKDVYSPSFPAEIFQVDAEFTRRYEYKGSSIVYDTRKVHTSKGLFSILDMTF